MWFMPIISDTGEVKIGKYGFEAIPGKKLKQTKKNKNAQVLQPWPSTCKALSSNSKTTRKN
jgi:hypothetical protein